MITLTVLVSGRDQPGRVAAAPPDGRLTLQKESHEAVTKPTFARLFSF